MERKEKEWTDEEILQEMQAHQEAAECYGFVQVIGKQMNRLLDLIHRLQDENKRLSIKVWNYEKPTEIPINYSQLAHCSIADCYRENEDLRRKNVELQKQVDELKEKQVIECHGMLNGCDMVKQAVKDTVKDLLIDFNEWINEHYDAKFNAYCVCIPVDKVSEFLMHKLKEYGVEVE